MAVGDDLKVLMETTTSLDFGTVRELLQVMATSSSSSAHSIASKGPSRVDIDAAMRATRRHPKIWDMLYHSYRSTEEVRQHTHGIIRVSSSAGLRAFTTLTWIVDYLHELGLEAHGQSYCRAFLEQTYCRLVFRGYLDEKLLISLLAFPYSFHAIISGPPADPRLKELVECDVQMFTPERPFFGLLDMIEACKGNKRTQKALINAVAAIPCSHQALEEAGFMPDPEWL